MKFYAKTGDDGQTGLIGGKRVEKDDARVVCYGDIDELNASVGLVVAATSDEAWRSGLVAIQRDLFALGSQLATPEGHQPPAQLDPSRTSELESMIDAVSSEVESPKNFVLPGGCELAAVLHMARTVCRRAERSTVSLRRVSIVDASSVAYLNRLGDLLFAMALAANRRAGVENTVWISDKQ